MIELNLATSCEEHELIKNYLQENISETLAQKINMGVRIEKDGKSLINKKDLNGFMRFASDEAKKLADKGQQFKAVHHDIVFGWAMHYFEEDSIEGTLLNLDGTPYQTPIKATNKTTNTTINKAKQKTEQYSLFDMLAKNDEPIKDEEDGKTKKLSSLSFKGQIAKNSQPDPLFDVDKDDDEDADDDIPNETKKQGIMAHLRDEEPPKIKVVEDLKPKISGFYLKYQEIQKRYPTAIVIYRLGDFYEVLGDNSKIIANSIGLTLTSRDCGLQERILMVGFPQHCADNYILKIRKLRDVVIVEHENKINFLPQNNTDIAQEHQKHWISENTYVDDNGVMHETPKSTIETPKFLLDVLANKITARY